MISLKLTLTGVPVIHDDSAETIKAAGRNRRERRANAARLRRMPIELQTVQEAARIGRSLAPGEYT